MRGGLFKFVLYYIVLYCSITNVKSQVVLISVVLCLTDEHWCLKGNGQVFTKNKISVIIKVTCLPCCRRRSRKRTLP